MTPCVLFALRRESAFFRRIYRPIAPVPGAPCHAQCCVGPTGELLLLETGIGPARVDGALDWLFARQNPGIVVFAGFAGALSDQLCVGDIMVATDVLDLEDRVYATSWPDASRANPGRLLTTAHLVGDSAEKHALASRYQAIAVDMESAHFAERCVRAGIRFGCVRAISDDVDTGLSPELVTLMSAGVVSPWRLAMALLRKPKLLGEMRRLARDTQIAARKLADALATLLTPIVPDA